MAQANRVTLDAGDQPARIEMGDLTVDFAAQSVRWRGKPIALGPNEFRLLGLFAGHPVPSGMSTFSGRWLAVRSKLPRKRPVRGLSCNSACARLYRPR